MVSNSGGDDDRARKALPEERANDDSDGTDAGTDDADVDEASDGEPADVTEVAGAARRSHVPTLAGGDLLAQRYQIEQQLGEGGSGTVFRAWDRALGELVAVKVLHPQRARERSWIKRLAREVKVARAIRHPNVCRVFELGHADGFWFVTMELGTAGTLRDRLRNSGPAPDGHAPAAPLRPLPQRLSDIEQLCAGLGAIHAVGFTHRDVTPQNVLVMADGRLIVTDFGLAIEHGDHTTVMGGTPAYMPPEAARGARSDQRSDVFQLGMIAHEILTGVRPTWSSDGQQMELIEPSANASATELQLLNLIAECVNPDPAKRPPTALAVAGRLAAAEAAREATWIERVFRRARRFGRRHRRLLLLAVAALALATIVRTVQVLSRPPLCRGASAQIAGIWDARRAEAVRRAFASTGKSYAADAFTRVRTTLDAFAQDWVDMYTDACEATHLRGEQSPEVLDLRMTCLKARSNDLRALADLFSSADDQLVARSVNAASGLAPVALCADVSVLRAVVPPPTNPEARARVDALRQRLSELKAQYVAGRFVEGARRLPDLVRDARALDYGPVLAEALQVEGDIGIWTRPPEEVSSVFQDALLQAEASRHDRVLAEVAVDYASFLSFWGRFDDLDRFVPRARATLTRIGGDLRLESWLDTAIAIGLEKRKRDTESLVMHQRALALKQRVLGNDHWDVALSMGNVAERLRALGRNGEALAQNTEAIARLQRALGPHHPDLALHLFNRGDIHLAQGETDLALADYRRALAIWQDALPADHPYLAYALTGIGRALIKGGQDVAGAIAPLEHARTVREAAKVTPDLRAETTFALAQALWLTGRDRARALHLAEDARALYDDAHAEERALVEQSLSRWRAADAPAARQRTSAKASTSPAP